MWEVFTETILCYKCAFQKTLTVLLLNKTLVIILALPCKKALTRPMKVLLPPLFYRPLHDPIFNDGCCKKGPLYIQKQIANAGLDVETMSLFYLSLLQKE
jgi:hypothetical protein